MASGKAFKLWVVNVASFVFFSLLGLTGLINWLVLPSGYEAGSGFVIGLRHFLREIHEWTALGFMLCIGLHIFLHWPYVKGNLQKHGILKD
ncbi:MAG: DUF4405 domain-containing protein [Desulfobacterales bacterium]|nr:DUF4405 domain-containing protein [Desulfobacterales bacterium]